MHLLASVRQFVCLFVYALTAMSNNLKSAAKKNHYQSMVFVCVSVISSADAVDQLLISIFILFYLFIFLLYIIRPLP